MGVPDFGGCRIQDNMMLLRLTLAAVATVVSSEAGISYTAEPFNANQQLSEITYTAEPFKTEINTKPAIQPITTYASLPETYTPINTLSSPSSSYPYTLPLSYNMIPAVSSLYTNTLPLTSSNWYYNTKPISSVYSNIVPASTRAISSASSPLVRALYSPAIVQPLAAIKHMAKREAEAGMTYTAEPFKSKSMTYTAEPFKSRKPAYKPPHSLPKPKPVYSGIPINYAYTYQHPVSYNSFINPTSYPTAYTLPYASSYMYPTGIQPSTYTYNTHPSNFGVCLNNLGAQVPC